MKNQKHVFAVVRVDQDMPTDSALENKITIKEIIQTQEMAEFEVKRLNQLNKNKRCIYFWQTTRMKEFKPKQKENTN